MPIDWAPFVDIVRRNKRFLLTTHVRPDPDGLGSQLGLADVLDGMGKDVRLVIASNWPPRYNFLDPELKKLPQRHQKFKANRSMRDVEPSVNVWLRTLDDVEIEDEEDEA